MKLTVMLNLGTLGMVGHISHKWWYKLLKTLMFTCMQKKNSITNSFLEASLR